MLKEILCLCGVPADDRISDDRCWCDEEWQLSQDNRFLMLPQDDRFLTLMALHEVSDDMDIEMAFYNPDDQFHRQKAKELQEDGVHLVAMVGVDDKRALPEHAQAMICCEDARLVSQSIANFIVGDDNSMIGIDFNDWLNALNGVFYHQRFTGMGDNRVQLIVNQFKGILSKSHNTLCLIRGYEVSMCEVEQLVSHLVHLVCDDDWDSVFFTAGENENLQNEMVVDLLYSLA